MTAVVNLASTSPTSRWAGRRFPDCFAIQHVLRDHCLFRCLLCWSRAWVRRGGRRLRQFRAGGLVLLRNRYIRVGNLFLRPALDVDWR